MMRVLSDHRESKDLNAALTLAECADPKNRSLTPLESAVLFAPQTKTRRFLVLSLLLSAVTKKCSLTPLQSAFTKH